MACFTIYIIQYCFISLPFLCIALAGARHVFLSPFSGVRLEHPGLERCLDDHKSRRVSECCLWNKGALVYAFVSPFTRCDWVSTDGGTRAWPSPDLAPDPTISLPRRGGALLLGGCMSGTIRYLQLDPARRSQLCGLDPGGKRHSHRPCSSFALPPRRGSLSQF